MRRRQVYVSVAAGKTETAVHIIHNIHICGCVKMHLFSFLCGCVMMKTMRSGMAGRCNLAAGSVCGCDGR